VLDRKFLKKGPKNNLFISIVFFTVFVGYTVEPVLTLNADIPPRVQHDMVFLKESWANMQEQEEAEAKFLAEVEASEVGLAAHQQESSFQMVTSKNKKKKSKSPVKKATYDTRSKVLFHKLDLHTLCSCLVSKLALFLSLI
jgi:hypothetical protein